jgi:hypothetical protein
LRLARRPSIQLDKQLNCHKVSLQRRIEFGGLKKTKVSWASLLPGGAVLQPCHIWIAAGAELAAICFHGAALYTLALSGLTLINFK